MGTKDRLGINLSKGTELELNSPEQIRTRSHFQSLLFAALPILSTVVVTQFAPTESSLDFIDRAKIMLNIPTVFLASEFIGHRGLLPTIAGVALGIGGAYILRESFPVTESPWTMGALLIATAAGLLDSYGTGSIVAKLVGGKALEAGAGKVEEVVNNKINERRTR